MKKIEEYGKIVCASLLHNNCIYMGREGHHIIFPMEPLGVLRCAKQGFVTENGYFVDRKTALLIAKHYNQINHKYNPEDCLVSEDLKKENLKVRYQQEGYLYKEKTKGILMKTYDKEQVIYEIISLLKYHSDNKNCLKLANLLISKATNEKTITLSQKEIKEVLFETETQEINIMVLNALKHLKADLSGISFAKKVIEGINFTGLEGVTINLDEVPDKNLTNTTFTGVTLTGTLDNAKLGNTDFTGFLGELSLDPQKVKDKTISGTKLAGLTITGSFDGIVIRGVDFTKAKGDIKINPQKVPQKDLMCINFSGVTFCGENENEEPSFDDCIIYDCKFKNLKNKITINLDTLDASLFPKLTICDLTDVTVIGKTKSHYEAKHSVREDGSILFENVQDDLYGSYYYDANGDYVHIYLYESMKWDGQNKKWLYLPRAEETNLKIEVEFKQKEKNPKSQNKKETAKQKILRRLGLKPKNGE